MKEEFLRIVRVVGREIWKERMDREITLSSYTFDFLILSFNAILQAEINSFGPKNGGNLRRKIPY